MLLNDPVFVEASRAFAEKILRQEGDAAAKVRWAWQQALSRNPTEEELVILQGVLNDQQERFASDPESAAAFVEIGEKAVPADLEVTELAAWTQVSRTILNAYETTSRN